MQFLCLIYSDEKTADTMSQAEQAQYFADYGTFTKAITDSGHYRAGEALLPVSSARTVRVRGKEVTVTDGPFAETKEQLGGFYLVEAKDIEEASQIAARIPTAKHGSIEVRPIMVF